MLAFLLSLSLAAEIQILTADPVAVEINGKPVAAKPGERGVTANNLAGGVHRVQVFDTTDKLITSIDVNVAVGDQLRLELRRGLLQELGRGALPGATPCPTPVAVTPAPPAPGSLQITGVIAAETAVWVNGTPVPYRSDKGSFVMESVPAGTHDVRVVTGAATLWQGPMKIYPGLIRRCFPTTTNVECGHMETFIAVAPTLPTKPQPMPRPTAVAGPKPMDTNTFAVLVAAVEAESFSSDQLDVVRSAASANYFTIAQVGQLLDCVSMSSDKLAVARLVAPKTVDRANAWQLNSHLTFSSDKEAVAEIFR